MSEANAAVEKRRPARSWRQFSLRSMLIVWIGLGFFAGWAAGRIRLRSSVNAVREAGGEVWYEPGPLAFAADYLPTWLGEDVSGTVVRVRFTGGLDAKTTAELRPHLESLRSIETLTFGWGWRDNVDVGELPPLPNLEMLQVSLVGPAGSRVARFSRLPHLQRLWISGKNLGSDWSVFSEGWPALEDLSLSGLDDAGAESLAKNLRKISTLRLVNSSLSEPGLRAVASIPGLKTVILNESLGGDNRRTRSDFLQQKQRIEELLPHVKVIAHWI